MSFLVYSCQILYNLTKQCYQRYYYFSTKFCHFIQGVNMITEKQNTIDAGLLGALIRHERQEQGYSTAEEFAAAITEMTGYSVSKETIYKIESGKQEPKLSLFIAINFLLFQDEKPSLGKEFNSALPKYWQNAIEHYYMDDAEVLPDKTLYIDIPRIAKQRAKETLGKNK